MRKLRKIAESMKSPMNSADAANYMRRNLEETEQRVTEQYAKDNGLWLPLANIPSLGVPGPSGNKNDLYVSDDVVFRDCRELSKVEAFRKYVVYATLNAPKRIVIQPPQ